MTKNWGKKYNIENKGRQNLVKNYLCFSYKDKVTFLKKGTKMFSHEQRSKSVHIKGCSETRLRHI